MKLFIIFVATLCSINCAQLNNNYLPPAGAGGSSGASVPGGLQAPRAPGNNALGGISPGRPQAPSPNRPASPSSGKSPSSPSSPSGPPIEIISYENVNNGDGSYKWSYESANGIKAQEMGDVKNKGSENAIQTAQGSYSFTSPEGQFIQISYTADENGFEAVGDAIPTPVPLPEANLLAIAEFEAAYATAVPESESKTSGGSPGQPSRPNQQGAQQPSRPNQPGAQQSSRPNQPGAQQSSRPAAAPGGFATQPRPSGGSGNYSPDSGYKY